MVAPANEYSKAILALRAEISELRRANQGLQQRVIAVSQEKVATEAVLKADYYQKLDQRVKMIDRLNTENEQLKINILKQQETLDSLQGQLANIEHALQAGESQNIKRLKEQLKELAADSAEQKLQHAHSIEIKDQQAQTIIDLKAALADKLTIPTIDEITVAADIRLMREVARLTEQNDGLRKQSSILSDKLKEIAPKLKASKDFLNYLKKTVGEEQFTKYQNDFTGTTETLKSPPPNFKI